jgi:MFS family permease
MLQPLRHRDVALLYAGQATSLAGDGLYAVALPFLVLDLDNSAGALSLVLLAWSIGLVTFLLVGGIAADRGERRRVLVIADAVRLLAVGAIGLLAVLGDPEPWHVAALAFAYGAGEAFFQPAFGAIVPALVPGDELVQANSLHTFLRPLALRFAGPALGGVLVAAIGPGPTLLVDAATFAVSLACVLAMRVRSRPAGEPGHPLRELVDGWRYVRSQPWLWATLISAAAALLAFFGPLEVLLPYIVRNDLGGDAGDYGLVLASLGVGAMLGSAAMSRRELPRRPVRFLYASWTVSCLALGGWGIATQTWQLAALGAAQGLLNAFGLVTWVTLMQRRVPPELLGRVTALDWFVSVGLTPVSFALVAPVAAGLGERETLLAAGLTGALVTLACLPLALRAPARAS